MMVTEIKGFGSQSGHTEIYRGAEYAVNFRAEGQTRDRRVLPTDGRSGRRHHLENRQDRQNRRRQDLCSRRGKAVRVRTGETNEDAL